jgi:hypothetical protein
MIPQVSVLLLVAVVALAEVLMTEEEVSEVATATGEAEVSEVAEAQEAILRDAKPGEDHLEAAAAEGVVVALEVVKNGKV